MFIYSFYFFLHVKIFEAISFPFFCGCFGQFSCIYRRAKIFLYSKFLRSSRYSTISINIIRTFNRGNPISFIDLTYRVTGSSSFLLELYFSLASEFGRKIWILSSNSRKNSFPHFLINIIRNFPDLRIFLISFYTLIIAVLDRCSLY